MAKRANRAKRTEKISSFSKLNKEFTKHGETIAGMILEQAKDEAFLSRFRSKLRNLFESVDKAEHSNGMDDQRLNQTFNV